MSLKKDNKWANGYVYIHNLVFEHVFVLSIIQFSNLYAIKWKVNNYIIMLMIIISLID